MAGVLKRTWIRVAVTVRQSKGVVIATLAWLVVNAVLFAILFKNSWPEAALLALCIRKTEGAWGRFYTSFTEVVRTSEMASTGLISSCWLT